MGAQWRGLAGGEGDIPHGAELAKEVEKLLWSNVEAAVDEHAIRQGADALLTSGSLRIEL